MLTTRPSRWARSVGSVAPIRRWTPMTFTSNRGGPCTEAACHKTQVIVLDVASDTQWDTYGWRTAALTHGLKSVLVDHHTGLEWPGIGHLRDVLARAAQPN